MATQAHCAFCFEVLAANLEGRQPLSFAQVTDLWNHYSGDSLDSLDSEEAPPADTDTEAVGSDVEDAIITTPSLDPTYRPAAVSRLMAYTPSSESSSSLQSPISTPSRASEASSATSKSSSRSSLFSPLRKLRREKAATADQYPLFVTYNVIQKDGERRLRGCIGTFEPHELESGLGSYALTSAFDDTRFRPITSRELPTLECGVTLLTDFEPISDPMDWEIGTHGLRISFTYHNRRYGSTYLPDVAKEQGWTKEETLVSLMRKAGWSGRKEEWKKVPLNVVRYQGSKAKLDYTEWSEWRAWVEENVEA